MTAVSARITAAGLLAAYAPSVPSLFVSPRGTMLAEGTDFAVPIPFDPDATAHLVVPQRVRQAGPRPADRHHGTAMSRRLVS